MKEVLQPVRALEVTLVLVPIAEEQIPMVLVVVAAAAAAAVAVSSGN